VLLTEFVWVDEPIAWVVDLPFILWLLDLDE